MGELRLRLLIAYDGRPFRGWQSQASNDAVQDHLEAAIAQILGRRAVVHGSGRTDAGVHALGQVAHVEVGQSPLPLDKWRAALNANLPAEIRVLAVSKTKADFHARFNAQGKIYQYRIWNGPYFPPHEIGRAWYVPIPLDLGVLRQCAALLVGRHDFAGFAANRGPANRGPAEEDTVRTIRSIGVTARGGLITLRFEGSGFLYKMVRMLTATLVRCAQGRAEPSLIENLLAAPRAAKTKFAAPPDGLYLTRVIYGPATASKSSAQAPRS